VELPCTIPRTQGFVLSDQNPLRQRTLQRLFSATERVVQWPLRWPPSRRPPYPPPPPYPPRPPPPPGGRCSRGRASFTVNGRPSMAWPLSFEMAF